MRRPVARVSLSALALVGSALPCVADGPLHYYTLSTPCRLVDTRTTNPPSPMASLSSRAFTVKGACGVATDAKAVLLNITATQPGGAGYLTLYPTGVPASSSNINFVTNDTIANGGTVALASSATNDLTVFAWASGGTVHVILDVTGYFK